MNLSEKEATKTTSTRASLHKTIHYVLEKTKKKRFFTFYASARCTTFSRIYQAQRVKTKVDSATGRQ